MSALERPIPISFFDGLKLTRPRVETLSIRVLSLLIPAKTARTKDELPMLKLAVMEGGAKREHVRSLTGAMADYDGGKITIGEAAERLHQAGVAALLYSSPSSTVDAPRWRALAPYTVEANGERHQFLTDCLNGALGGIIDDAASWEIQQRFYYGQAHERDAKKGGGIAEPVEVLVVDGDFIDRVEIQPAPRPSRVKAVREDPNSLADLLDDDDDLFDLLRTSPLGLAGSEIDDILAHIPNGGEGTHYDDYVKVGMALHHEFGGTNEGFERWCEWAKQSSKFDPRNAAHRWKSFSQDTKTPVRMASLIQEANANRLAEQIDFDAGPRLPAVVDPTDLTDLLGDGPPVEAQASKTSAYDPDWKRLLDLVADGEKKGSIKHTMPNLRLILSNDPRTHDIIGFNEFMQEIVLTREPGRATRNRERPKPLKQLDGDAWANVDPVNGNLWLDIHDHAIRELFELPMSQGGYGIKITDRDLKGAVAIVADEHRFHPIRDRLDDLVWDGKTRSDRLYIDYLGAEDTAYHRAIGRLTVLGAVARIYEPGHKFDFVPILMGAQGIRKSTFIETLAWGWFAELEGDLQDRKAMVEKMQGAWILEIPEMQGFSKADANTVKGLISARHDKVRMSYARRAQIFYRQCVFIGSTNEDEILRDPTGARRFWPVFCSVTSIDIERLKRELTQIWAEAVHLYKAMRVTHKEENLPLYITDSKAAEQAKSIQAAQTAETGYQALAGEIGAWLDRPIGADEQFDDLDIDAPKIYRNETCISQIWSEMMGRDGPTTDRDVMIIGKALKEIGWTRSRNRVGEPNLQKKYGYVRVYYRSRS